MRRVSILACMLVAAGALAGCLSDSGTQDLDVRTEPDTGSDLARLEERSEVLTGEFTTTFLLAVSSFLGDTETMRVHSGAVEARINASVEALPQSDVRIRFVPPGCNVNEEACDTWVETSGGEASHVFEDPEPGDWNVVFFSGSASTGSYSIEVTQQVLVQPGDADAEATGGPEDGAA